MKLELVENWKSIALRAHSEVAQLAGIVCLITPEVLFLLLERDVASPRLWWWLALALLVYGYIGRLVKQRSLTQ